MKSRPFQPINTEKAPRAIGPYSQAIQTEAFLFISGQIPIDPTVGKIIESNIEGQTKQVLNNLNAILQVAGLTFKDVVKTEIFIKDMNHFKIINDIYAEAFAHDVKPARQVIEVSRLPMDALIEISCVALRSS